MTRKSFEGSIHPAIQEKYTQFHADVVKEVADAVAQHDVVVVGMAQNPFCKRARKALKAIDKPFTYLEYGSYLSEWKPRLAIKMWAGWPTFPLVFVGGTLIGGATDLEAFIKAGGFQS